MPEKRLSVFLAIFSGCLPFTFVALPSFNLAWFLIVLTKLLLTRTLFSPSLLPTRISQDGCDPGCQGPTGRLHLSPHAHGHQQLLYVPPSGRRNPRPTNALSARLPPHAPHQPLPPPPPPRLPARVVPALLRLHRCVPLSLPPLLPASPNSLSLLHPPTSALSPGPTSAANPSHQSALKPLLASLHGTILDIGPGPGDQLPLLAPHAARLTRVYALEPTTTLHAALRTKAKECGLGDKYVVLAAGAQPAAMIPALHKAGVEPRSVDGVVSIKSLCSCPQAEVPGILQAFQGLLRQGGSYVFLEHVGNRADAVSGWYQWVLNWVSLAFFFSFLFLWG